MSDTLFDFWVGGVAYESDLPSLVDIRLLDLFNREDVSLPANFPSLSCFPTRRSRPIIDRAHLFSSNVDTTLLYPQPGDSTIAHPTSNTPFPNDDIFASTSMLANDPHSKGALTFLERAKLGQRYDTFSYEW